MKTFNVKQGSLDWQKLRAGIPTGSGFEKILTPGGKASKQATDYLHQLIAEAMLGCPINTPTTSWMERGLEMEGEAVCFYEFERDVAVEEIGFISNDAGDRGVSPDRLIGTDGMLEIKCPSPQVHVGYLLYDSVAAAYKSQLQGQLYVCERRWVDICSYHPLLPPSIVRVERDDEYIALLHEALDEFCAKLDAERNRLAEMGYKIHTRRTQA